MRSVYEQQKKYIKEFKREAIKQVTERGYSVADIWTYTWLNKLVPLRKHIAM